MNEYYYIAVETKKLEEHLTTEKKWNQRQCDAG